MSNKTNILLIKNLSHYFMKKGKKIELFQNIFFSLNLGEIVALVGKSGIGKSTFLNIAAGLDNCIEGEILIDGKIISRCKESQLSKIRNEKIGFIFQHFNLIKELNVLENIMVPAMIKRKNYFEIQNNALALLKSVGLEDRQEHNIAELSGGEMQRVTIARALINQPKIVFADEPTGNLDEKNSFEIFELFKSLSRKKKCSILMVTHSISLAKRCDLIYKIKDKNIFKLV